jgi:lipoprotein-anchoring transpeptidase ErfK/SrfK
MRINTMPNDENIQPTIAQARVRKVVPTAQNLSSANAPTRKMPVAPDAPSPPSDVPAPSANVVKKYPAPIANYPAPQPVPQPKAMPRPKRAGRGGLGRGLLIIGFSMAIFMVASLGAILIGLNVIYRDGILPAVTVGDVALGGMDIDEATQALQSAWDTVIVRDGERTWTLNADLLGITLDVQTSAELAYAYGRETGNGLQGMLGHVEIAPVMSINRDMAYDELTRIADQMTLVPVNAGIVLVNGDWATTPSQSGRVLDVDATLTQWTQGDTLANSFGTDGALDLVMREVAPAVPDATPILAQAQAVLSSPLDIRIFDPVTGDSVYWSVPAEQWGTWVTAIPDATSAFGLALGADSAPIRDYLTQQANVQLDASRSLDFDNGVADIMRAIGAGDMTGAWVTVQHQPRTHIVQAGESITSIAWDYGVPYPYIQEANNNLQGVDIGQAITIPPADAFLLKPVVPNKRIVVSISQQRTWVYQDGQLIHEWASSTGISDSPTWQGVYQIISHERNAYAANWDLWMPYFMGVYQPIPHADFTNGFHGFPTRGGGQLLWENSLGRRVTYGCILLSNTNAAWLFDWAEEGVVVEIQA